MSILPIILKKKKMMLGTLLNYFVHYYVNESVARVAPRNTVYAGTVRSVGSGQTYATITAAIAAASSGDIIQLADGTYDMKDEPSTYLLWDAQTKNLLIRGNASDRSAVNIIQTGANNFTIRLYKAADVRFEDLTITANKNLRAVYQDYNAGFAMNTKFKNVKFISLYNGSSAGFLHVTDNLHNTVESRIEFEQCSFERKLTTAAVLFNLIKLGSNTQILYSDCDFDTDSGNPIYILDGNRCKIAVYNCSATLNNDNVILQIGQDTAVPTELFGFIDIRENDFSYATGKGSHAILIGRGTNSYYSVNNRIAINRSNSASIGIVIKSISDNLNNAVCAGNYIEAPRGIYLKGTTYNTIRYNSVVSNDAVVGESIVHANTDEGDGVLVSNNNHVTKNNLLANRFCISVYGTQLTPPANESIQDSVFDDNRYYIGSGVWAYDGTNHNFETKETFWTDAATNDDNSKLLTLNNVVISSTKKDV